MRILFVSPIYRPEMGAFANRLYPFTRQLVENGHEVFVATGMPNYPKGRVFDGYEGHRTFDEQIDGVNVLRSSYYIAPRNKSTKSQLRSYLSFLPAAYRSGLRAGKVDIVVASSPPIFPIIPASMLAKKSGAKLVFDIRDLWPDEVIACAGVREGSAPVKVIRYLERMAYKRASLVACTTDSFIETVQSRGVSPDKTALITNGADLQIFRPLPPDNAVTCNHDFEGKFVVMYVGLLGLKHGLEALIEAADRLREHKDIVFAIAGSGAKEQALHEMVKERNLENVLFCGELKVEEVPYMIARADVCVSLLDGNPYFKKILSVKLFEYMACRKPIIGLHDGESARLLQKSEAGVVVPPGDHEALAQAVLDLRKDPATREAMAKRGREFVEHNYSREATARKFESLLLSLNGEPTPPSTVNDQEHATLV